MKNPFRKYNLSIHYGMDDVCIVAQALTDLDYEEVTDKVFGPFRNDVKMTVAPRNPLRRIDIHELQDWFAERGYSDRINVSWC